MNTLFEFLSNEPLDNVITCMNYMLDRVVFFGYQNLISAQKKSLDNFLRNKCQVISVDYCIVSPDDYSDILQKMDAAFKTEIEAGNKIYFDITGGESLILVAFGNLSSRYDASIHYYDVMENRIFELDNGATGSICRDVTARRLSMTIADFVMLAGGVINMDMHKPEKNYFSQQDFEDVDAIWRIISNHKSKWSTLSTFIRGFLQTENNDNLLVAKKGVNTRRSLENSNVADKVSYEEIVKLIHELEQARLVSNVKINDSQFTYRYKNQIIKSCIEITGNALEMKTYQMLKPQVDDCMIGVHLDWDGCIHERPGEDVCNEIDVMGIKSNIPIFVSCKIGKQSPQKILSALYELDTVADRFGRKYAKKQLNIVNDIPRVYKERARIMGIDVVVL